MPKRPETPPIQTGTHLVTIWNPWPADIRVDPKKGLHPDDCRDLARWISCIVGVDNVLSLYYKPRSKDTIIVEVSEFNQHKGRILGEHLWISVFKKVLPEDKSKSSKLYLCPLGNYLELEKQRWKETKVDPDWFKSWNPNKNSMVHMPYPKSKWCDLPDHHGIDEFCGKIPVSLFPEEEAARAKPKEQELPDSELSALATPGAAGWSTARGEGNRTPATRIRPALDPASVPQPKQPMVRNYRKVATVTTEQSMRAVLGPPPSAPKPLATGESGEPSLEPEDFDWFEDVEEQDTAAEWRQQEPPNWDFKELSIEERTSTSPSVATTDNAWDIGPSWGDESTAPSSPVASTSRSPEPRSTPASPPPTSKVQAWQKKTQPARNAWGPKPPAAPKPSPASSNKTSDTEWQTPGKGKGKATPQASGGAGKGRGWGRGQQQKAWS